jgi:hypothetical protein
MSASVRQLLAVLRDAKCPRCGLRTIQLNTAGYRQPYRPESADPETFCSCPDTTTADGAE